MSKTLTVRITESDLLKKLKRLRVSCYKNTDTGLIKHLISSYGNLERWHNESLERIQELEEQLEQEIERRESFSNALSSYIGSSNQPSN